MPTIDVHGVKLAYEERGSGPAVLLVHGTGGAVWDPLPEQLAAAGYLAISYHRRGFGESLHEPIKDPPRHTADAAALIEALVPGPAIVVGHSMGGVIALDLAVRRPRLVRALVLVEPPLHLRKHPSAKMMRNVMASQAVRLTRGPEKAAVRFMRWATTTTDGANGFEATPPEAQALLVGNSAAIMRELDSGTGEHVKPAEIAAISCPVVILVGDMTLPDYARAAQRIVAARPASAIVNVPGAGHVLPLSHPQAVVDAVRGVSADAPVEPSGGGPAAAS